MRFSRLTTVIAAFILVPAFVVVPTVLGSASDQPEPVVTSQEEVELLAPGNAAVGDGQVASGRDVVLAKTQAAKQGASVSGPQVLQVTAPQQVPQGVTVMGVTWHRGSSPALTVQFRSRAEAGWTAWQAVDVDPSRDADAASDTVGSDPIVVTGASQVQARVLGPAGATPAGARLTIIDPGTSDSDSRAGARPVGGATAAEQLKVYSRAEWGADESIRREDPSYGQVRGVIVHHTAGTNDYSPDQVPSILRGIYSFHVKGRGWNDVGYNFLVDKWGRVWEGRAGGLDRAVVGAHTLGYNTQTMGISVMGDYSVNSPSDDAVSSVAAIIGWKANIHGFSPTGQADLYGRTFPAVIGHRDANNTDCPGNYLYGALSTIRQRAAADKSVGAPVITQAPQAPSAPPAPPATTSSPPTTAAPPVTQAPQAPPTTAAPKPTQAPKPPLAPARDLDGRSGSDVVVRANSGALVVYSAASSSTLSEPHTLTDQWAGNNLVLRGDWNGDRIGDIIARDAVSGRLKLYPGTADGTLGSVVLLGRGWGSMPSIVAPGDMSGDGKPDVLAVSSSGRLLLFRGTGGGALAAAQTVGRGWLGMARLVGVGDWTGDGKADLIGVTKQGEARIYPGAGGGLFATATSIGGGWHRYTAVVGLPAGTGDARAGVMVVGADGGASIARPKGALGVSWSRVSTRFVGSMVYSG